MFVIWTHNDFFHYTSGNNDAFDFTYQDSTLKFSKRTYIAQKP